MLQCGRSRYESVMLSLKDPPPKPSSLLPSEHGEEEDADAAKAAATAVSAKDLMVVGQRVKVCFRREANDSVGQWFGGIVAKVTRDADLCVIALDDGDSVVYTAAEMRGLIELRKFGKLEDTRGMVTDVWQAERALSVSCVKVGTVLHPAGVLVGDGVTTLCEKPIYSGHHLSHQLVWRKHSAAQNSAAALEKRRRLGRRQAGWAGNVPARRPCHKYRDSRCRCGGN